MEDVHAGRAQAGGEGAFVNVARKPGVFADDHPVPPFAGAKVGAGRKPKSQSHVREHGVAIDRAAHAVRAEKSLAHKKSVWFAGAPVGSALCCIHWPVIN